MQAGVPGSPPRPELAQHVENIGGPEEEDLDLDSIFGGSPLDQETLLELAGEADEGASSYETRVDGPAKEEELASSEVVMESAAVTKSSFVELAKPVVNAVDSHDILGLDRTLAVEGIVLTQQAILEFEEKVEDCSNRVHPVSS